MKREIFEGKEYLVGYHSQENRKNSELIEPIECNASDAWLGTGYYFWVEEEFAKYYGEDYKTNKGKNTFDIYKANLQTANFLNTTFIENDYFLFKEIIEESIKKLQSADKSVTLLRVYEYLSDEYWRKLNISGIIYDDLPNNGKNKTRIQSPIKYEENSSRIFYYKKRIQIVVFELKDICNFTLYLKNQKQEL